MELNCTITTPEKLVHDGAAKLVVVPATDGELGVMPGHAPLMALLGTGELRIQEPGGARRSLFVQGGFVQIIENAVNVLATDAESAADIDLASAEAELARLEGESPTGLSAVEREARMAELAAAKVRVRIASRAAS